jgi:transposase-like protein/G:T-mismatch repair DNA endonuclease (very short patch repair protein)
MKKQYKDKGWLKFQYVTLNRNPDEIAKECGVTTLEIFRQLKNFNLLKLRKTVIKLKEPPNYQKKEWLEEEYVNQKKTIKQIAKKCGLKDYTIYKWLKKFNIPIRGSTGGMWTDKKWLKHQIIDLNKSVKEVAVLCNTTKGTIWRWMKIHNIKIIKEKPKYMDERWLRKEYENNHKSTKKIARELNCSPQTINNWLYKFKIPIRPKTELRIKGEGKYANREWLEEKFNDMSKTLPEIAKECGISVVTLKKWIKKHGIIRKDGFFPRENKDKKIMNEEWLYTKYWQEGKTLEQMAKEDGTHPQSVLRMMKIFNIPRRKPMDYKHPSHLELEFQEFIDDNNLPFEYTGTDYTKKIDFSKFPDVSLTSKLPDFIHKTKKIAIEISDKSLKTNLIKKKFKNIEELQQELTKAYEKVGWKVIFVWKDEFDKNPDKILDEIKKII